MVLTFVSITFSSHTVIVFAFVKKVRSLAVFNIFTGTKVRGFCHVLLLFLNLSVILTGILSSRIYADRQNRELKYTAKICTITVNGPDKFVWFTMAKEYH